MREIEVEENQVILNKIHSKSEFTHEFGVDANKRYIVGCDCVSRGTNPSRQSSIRGRLTEALKDKDYYDSVSGWMDTEFGVYTVHINQHFDNIDQALKMAKLNNMSSVYDKESEEILYLTKKKIR